MLAKTWLCFGAGRLSLQPAATTVRSKGVLAVERCLIRRQTSSLRDSPEILCFAPFEANPLCQDCASSINLRQPATMMVTIWRRRASVLA